MYVGRLGIQKASSNFHCFLKCIQRPPNTILSLKSTPTYGNSSVGRAEAMKWFNSIVLLFVCGVCVHSVRLLYAGGC